MIKVKIYYQKLKLIVYELNSVRLRILGYGNKLEINMATYNYIEQILKGYIKMDNELIKRYINAIN